MVNKLVISLFSLAVLANVQAQQLTNTGLTGNVIGTYSISLYMCSYICENQSIAGCVGWTFDSSTSLCQFFSSVASIVSSPTSNYISLNNQLRFIFKIKCLFTNRNVWVCDIDISLKFNDDYITNYHLDNLIKHCLRWINDRIFSHDKRSMFVLVSIFGRRLCSIQLQHER